jgi:hypothetical protein
MAQLTATIICLALAISATPARRPAPPTPAARRGTATATTPPEPLDELPKAPVEIVLPPPAPKREKASTSAGPGLAPAVPAPPRPPSQSPPPAPARPAVGGAMPSDAEILAAATGEIADSRPGYALVQQKCGRCHPMEKTIEAGFAPDDWEPYLRRKLRRHGAGISPEQATEIVRFLSTWARQRSGQ